MMEFLSLLRIELRNVWLPCLACFLVLGAAWLLVPSYPVWMVLSFALCFCGLAGKINQCRKDMKNQNMNVLFALPVSRGKLLAARILSGAFGAWGCYGGTLLLMHLVSRFDFTAVSANTADMEWYLPQYNVFFHFATDRSGMFALTPQMILHVLLALLLFTLFIELFYVVRVDCILPYGFCVVLMILFKFLCLSAKKGDIMIYFLVSSLPLVAMLLYYAFSFAIIWLFLRKFVRGCDYEYEDYESTTGNSVE